MEEDIGEEFQESAIVQDVFEYYMNSTEWEMLTNNLQFGKNWVRDLRNQKFGKVTALIPFRNRKTNDPAIFWLCHCECGNFFMTRVNNVDKNTSCGCDKQKNYIEVRNGHIKCINQSYTGYILNKNLAHRLVLTVRCDCGNTILMSSVAFNNRTFCNKDCKYSNWNQDNVAEKNGKRIKSYFKAGTNISKIGTKQANRNSTTGYKGVYYSKVLNKYLAYIIFQGKRYDLGYYDNPEYASNVRSKAQDLLSTEFIENFNEDNFVQDNKHLKNIYDKVRNRIIKKK